MAKSPVTKMTLRIVQSILAGKTVMDIAEEMEHTPKLICKQLSVAVANNLINGNMLHDPHWLTYKRKLLDIPPQNETYDKVLDMLKQGLPAKEVAGSMGISRTMVYRYAKMAKDSPQESSLKIVSARSALDILLERFKDNVDDVMNRLAEFSTEQEVAQELSGLTNIRVSPGMVKKLLEARKLSMSDVRHAHKDTLVNRARMRGLVLADTWGKFLWGVKVRIVEWLWKNGYVSATTIRRAQLKVSQIVRQFGPEYDKKKLSYTPQAFFAVEKGLQDFYIANKYSGIDEVNEKLSKLVPQSSEKSEPSASEESDSEDSERSSSSSS